MASRDDARKMPLSFAITAPRDALDRRIMVVVIARGRAASSEGETALAGHKVIAGFEPKRSLRLDVFLAAACIAQLCESEPETTCDGNGECGPIVERSDSPAANGGPLGGYVSLRGSSGDAGVDGAGDGQVSEETGPRGDGAIEAGTRCAATEQACDEGEEAVEASHISTVRAKGVASTVGMQ